MDNRNQSSLNIAKESVSRKHIKTKLANAFIQAKKDGNFQNFIKIATTAISQDDKYAFSYGIRADAKALSFDLKGAIEDATVAISLDSTFLEPYQTRAEIRKLQGDLKGAIEDATLALSLNSKSALAYRMRAEAKIESGDLKGGIEDATMAISLDEKTGNAYFAYQARAKAKRQSSDFKGAIEDATMAISLDDKCATAYRIRAHTKGQSGDLKGAIEDATMAISLNDKSIFAYQLRALAKMKSGDFEGTIEDATFAIALDEKYFSAYLIRAEANIKCGKFKAAIKDTTFAIGLVNTENKEFVRGLAVRAKAYRENNQPGLAFKDESDMFFLKKKKFVSSLTKLTKFFILENHGSVSAFVSKFKGNFNGLRSVLLNNNISSETIALTREKQGYSVRTPDIFTTLREEEASRQLVNEAMQYETYNHRFLSRKRQLENVKEDEPRTKLKSTKITGI